MSQFPVAGLALPAMSAVAPGSPNPVTTEVRFVPAAQRLDVDAGCPVVVLSAICVCVKKRAPVSPESETQVLNDPKLEPCHEKAFEDPTLM